MFTSAMRARHPAQSVEERSLSAGRHQGKNAVWKDMGLSLASALVEE